MWNTIKRPLIVASVALNVAFVTVWIVHAVTRRAHPQESNETTGQEGIQERIWCPLHRELAVTEEQWVQIEPRLRKFQAAVGELTQQVRSLRSEVIDLIAADIPDPKAIRAKQDEILATKRKVQSLVAAHLLAEKEILTPGQQTQLFEMLRQRISCGAGPPMSGRNCGPGIEPILGKRQEGTSAGGTR